MVIVIFTMLVVQAYQICVLKFSIACKMNPYLYLVLTHSKYHVGMLVGNPFVKKNIRLFLPHEYTEWDL